MVFPLPMRLVQVLLLASQRAETSECPRHRFPEGLGYPTRSMMEDSMLSAKNEIGRKGGYGGTHLEELSAIDAFHILELMCAFRSDVFGARNFALAR